VPGKINGFSIAYTVVGGIVLWSGIAGASVSDAFKDILAGKSVTSDGSEDIGNEPSTAAGGYDIATNIPAGKGDYTENQLQALWTDNGGPSDTAAFAAAVAMAESGGSATVTSANPDGGTNVGVFQLDTKGVGSGYSVAELQDANLNTQLTIMTTSGGTNWTQWGDPVTEAVGYHYTPGDPVP
jgi:hypothetical protein